MGIRPGAFEFPAWMPRRPGAAAAALALNAALGFAVFLSFEMHGSLDRDDAVSTLIWLPLSAPPLERQEPPRTKSRRPRKSSPRPSIEAPAPIVPFTRPLSVASPRAPIDWWVEGEKVVHDRARTATAAAVPDGRIDLHVRSPTDAPAHHPGESYRDEFGDRVVWVSEKCYIESAPPLPGTPPAFAAAGITRTFCPGDSSAPRGDLFKEVPAYRKYHPDAP